MSTKIFIQSFVMSVSKLKVRTRKKKQYSNFKSLPSKRKYFVWEAAEIKRKKHFMWRKLDGANGNKVDADNFRNCVFDYLSYSLYRSFVSLWQSSLKHIPNEVSQHNIIPCIHHKLWWFILIFELFSITIDSHRGIDKLNGLCLCLSFAINIYIFLPQTHSKWCKYLTFYFCSFCSDDNEAGLAVQILSFHLAHADSFAFKISDWMQMWIVNEQRTFGTANIAEAIKFHRNEDVRQ